jgi:CIC family chloride channel protein
LLLGKTIASAVSIGSGFRGGLFSTSLFLGSLFGSFIGTIVEWLVPMSGADPLLFALVGMGAVAAAIVGAPVTMIMLVLETTGDFSATIGVMVGVITAAIAVRHWFGYSFATWRFHLRGLKITSPEDVTWLDELKVAALMRRDPAVIAGDLPARELIGRFPAGSTKQVFVVDRQGGLCGIIDPAEVSRAAKTDEDATVGGLVSGQTPFLLPRDDLRVAFERFGETAQESLPVVDDPEHKRVIGYLTEAYALRRYAQELEHRRSVGRDDAGIFSPVTGKTGS